MSPARLPVPPSRPARRAYRQAYVASLLGALVLGALPGCGGGVPAEPVVLVIQDSTVPDARSIVTPAVLGLELGLEGSGVRTRVVEVDAFGADEVVDGDVVAAVIAPFTDPADGDLATLRDALVPMVSISDLTDRGPLQEPPLRAVVPSVEVSAEVARRAADCAAGDGSAWSEEFIGALAPIVRLPGAPAQVAAAAAERDCEGVVWGGDAVGGASLAVFLSDTAPQVSFTLAAPARTPGSADAMPLRVAAFGVCACVDLTTSVEPAAQRFLHRYQAANGLEPGPYAVEGFDVGQLLADLAGDAPTRDVLADALGGIERFDGLAGTYGWDERGDLQDPVVRIYERVGRRWLERPPDRVAPETTRA